MITNPTARGLRQSQMIRYMRLPISLAERNAIISSYIRPKILYRHITTPGHQQGSRGLVPVITWQGGWDRTSFPSLRKTVTPEIWLIPFQRRATRCLAFKDANITTPIPTKILQNTSLGGGRPPKPASGNLSPTSP